MKKKVRILFGTYLNAFNAQDINCLYISKYIDRRMFEIHMFSQGDMCSSDNVIVHRLSHNRFIKRIQKIVFMIVHRFDLYYLPRAEIADLVFAFLLHRSRIIVSSVEIERVLHNRKMRRYFCNYNASFFTLNEDLKDRIKKAWNVEVPLLYLGIDKPKIEIREKKRLDTVAFVGSLIERKRPDLFLDIAKMFPYVNFLLIGGGVLQNHLEERVRIESMKNVEITGKITNSEVYRYLNNCDVLVIVSENEGQPKVSLEAASVGVPTVYIKNNYRINFVSDGKTGYGVKNVRELIHKLNYLYDNPDLIHSMSICSRSISECYSWKLLVGDYEQYFMSCILKRQLPM